MICLVAALVASAATRSFADSEASVETHISGSSQLSVQVGNTVETSSSSGGTVEVRIETVEDGVKKTSEFRKTLAPGESFRYATTVESTSSRGSASVHSAAFIAATSGASAAGTPGRAATSARAAALQAAASASSATEAAAEPRAPSRLLIVMQHIRAVLRSLFTWW